VLLAERMHWTLDYVDNLDPIDQIGTIIVLSEKDKALNDEAESEKWRHKK
jgi:hypothetical protein